MDRSPRVHVLCVTNVRTTTALYHGGVEMLEFGTMLLNMKRFDWKAVPDRASGDGFNLWRRMDRNSHLRMECQPQLRPDGVRLH